MPLTLQCACEGAGAPVYGLQKLTFKLESRYIQDACEYGFAASARLYCTSHEIILSLSTDPDHPNGYISVDLDPVDDWLAEWESITFEVSFSSSIRQMPICVPGTILNFLFWIEATYGSVATPGNTTVAKSWNGEPYVNSHCAAAGYDYAKVLSIANGAGYMQMCESNTAFYDDCLGLTGSVTNFAPKPFSSVLQLTGTDICLCASEGTPPYLYTADLLPDGLTLDPYTGCISGTLSPNYVANQDVIFQVMDAADASDGVVCRFVPACAVHSDANRPINEMY